MLASKFESEIDAAWRIRVILHLRHTRNITSSSTVIYLLLKSHLI